MWKGDWQILNLMHFHGLIGAELTVRGGGRVGKEGECGKWQGCTLQCMHAVLVHPPSGIESDTMFVKF